MAIAVLDIDGTLVDTNYHHASPGSGRSAQHGIVLPIWRIHRHLGMGGDQLVEALTDAATERGHGDEIRDAETERYSRADRRGRDDGRVARADRGLKRRGHSVVLASSAKEDEVDHYLELLGARELADAWTTSADVEATKPAPDLVRAALERVGGIERRRGDGR